MKINISGPIFWILVFSLMGWQLHCSARSNNGTPIRYNIQMSAQPSQLPANGLAQAKIIAKVTSVDRDMPANGQFYLKTDPNSIQFSGDPKIKIQDGIAVFTIQAGIFPGQPIIGFFVNDSSIAEIQLTIDEDWSDRDTDGFPDVCELRENPDRQRFVDAFVAIAEAQLINLSKDWHEDQRDCAGLLRFAYREALKPHPAPWYEALHLQPTEQITEIDKFQYPDIPLIGVNLFRRNNRPLSSPNADSLFSPFAEAKYLLNYNCDEIGKSRQTAETGDLIFFFHFDDPEMPYHSMIFIKDPVSALNDRFIYHTGPMDSGPGEMRLLTRQTLNLHPDKRWHILPDNRFFLGFFRWKIIN